ncbi:hypothetical protein RR46_10785 [Papilio xuthus]|uniref:Uncharacterized protein n=1 Tax=Papilio xuthus TaxID=66420 RepID=A0A194PQW7_PAPXU|nr:hypothetical protein RR46_10785 [Papilio xuthus]
MLVEATCSHPLEQKQTKPGPKTRIVDNANIDLKSPVN